MMKKSKNFQQSLKKLRSISHKQVRDYMSTSVGVPNSMLSDKDKDRAIYLLSTTLVLMDNQLHKMLSIHDNFKNNIGKRIKNLQDSKTDKQDVIDELTEIFNFSPEKSEKKTCI